MTPDFPSVSNYLQDEIIFSIADIPFKIKEEALKEKWLRSLIKRMGMDLHSLSFIFCSDDYLHRINVEYLDHDTYTDVITFPYALPPVVHGDIYISVDRVKENAYSFGVPFSEEIARVMAHGTLHLCGIDDKTNEEGIVMKRKENEALLLLNTLRDDKDNKTISAEDPSLNV